MSPLGSVLLIVVLQAVAVLLLYRLLRRRRPADPSDISGAIDAIRSEVAQLLAELNNTADRNITVLEDRFARLQELVEAADRRLGLLRKEVDRPSAGTQLYNHLQRTALPDGEAGTSKAESPVPSVSLAPERTMPVSQPPQQGVTAPDADRSIRQRVLTLHRSGRSASTIANRLGVSIGEVELVISLESREPVRSQLQQD